MIRISRISTDKNKGMLDMFLEAKKSITGNGNIPKLTQGRLFFKSGSTVVSYSKFTFSIEADVSTPEHLEVLIRCIKKVAFDG